MYSFFSPNKQVMKSVSIQWSRLLTTAKILTLLVEISSYTVFFSARNFNLRSIYSEIYVIEANDPTSLKLIPILT